MPQPASVFLMYHELELPGRAPCQSEAGYLRYIISAEDFRNQMAALEEMGFRGVSMTRALRFEPGTVAITVDDGCQTDLLAIAPILREFRFGATFYVTAAFLGKPGYLRAADVRELSALGFEIGSHSWSHRYLTDLDDASLKQEIFDSKEMLEHANGKAVEHFSCPGGRSDRRTIAMAKRAGYRTLANSIPRANTPSTDPFSLGRVAVTRGLTKDAFQRLCRGEALWKLQLSAAVRQQGKRVLGNAAYDRVRAALLGR